MLSRRLIGGFFLRLLPLYVLLVLPWPGLKQTYSYCYGVVATVVFGSLVPGGSVRFEPLSEHIKGYDVKMHLVNRRTGATQIALTSSRDPAYFQTAFLVSLILATPLPWRRRLNSLLVGTALVHLAIFVKVLLTVLHGFTRDRVALLSPDPPWDAVLSALTRVAVADIVSLLTIPVMIWILVSFRQEDWEQSVQAGADRLPAEAEVE